MYYSSTILHSYTHVYTRTHALTHLSSTKRDISIFSSTLIPRFQDGIKMEKIIIYKNTKKHAHTALCPMPIHCLKKLAVV